MGGSGRYASAAAGTHTSESVPGLLGTETTSSNARVLMMSTSRDDHVWATKLEQLRIEFTERPGSLNRLKVRFRWWAPTLTYIPAFESLSAKRPSFRSKDRPRQVAVFKEPASQGHRAILVFQVLPEDLPPREGIGKGTLFGETDPGGVLCLATNTVTIWPMGPPQGPTWRTPRL